MRITNSLTSKLLRVSLISSFLIAAVSIIPLFVALQTTSYGFYITKTLVLSLNILLIWAVNIFLIYYFSRHHRNLSGNKIRYLLSFVLTVIISGSFLIFIETLELTDWFIPGDELAKFGERSIIVPFFSSFIINSLVLFIQEFVVLREKKTHVDLENARLKIENTNAVNQQLKQHIHPHFLFNSLSILKSLIHNNPALAEEYLIRLSDFLRISISANGSNMVRLKNELKMCEDFIEMQKIRFGNAIKILIDIPETYINKGFVPCFSLQLLLENAIKHNALTIDSPLDIKMGTSDGWLWVENNIQKKQSSEESTKSGLANLSERYRIISGDDIVVLNNAHTFKVSIKILDHENSNY
ncbi:MAG: sensor histidine kinase [Bacteroidales bacterium]